MSRVRGAALTPEEELERLRNSIRTQLALTEKGQVKSSAGNLIIVMELDPEFQNLFAVNEMSQELFWKGLLFQSYNVSEIQKFMQNNYAMNVSRSAVEDEARSRGEMNIFNPVRDYLGALTWDGILRIEQVLTDVLHVEASRLHMAYMTKFLVAMVKRVYEPGCKFDSIFTLIGAQGRRKGMFFECLAGDWYGTLDGHKIQDRDSKLAMHYSWINEIQEIDKLSSKADARDLKSTASTREDIFRAPYARTSRKYRRMFLIVGSANEPEGLLTDFTGNRRWWIILLPDEIKIDVALLEMNRDMIWAEAVALYRAGTQVWLEDEELEALQVAACAPFEAYDPYQDLLDASMDRIKSSMHFLWHSKHVKGATGQELFDLIQVPENLRIQAAGNIMRVLAPALKKRGWEKERNGGREAQATRWFPPDWEDVIKTRKNGYPGMGTAPPPLLPGVVPLIPIAATAAQGKAIGDLLPHE